MADLMEPMPILYVLYEVEIDTDGMQVRYIEPCPICTVYSMIQSPNRQGRGQQTI